MAKTKITAETASNFVPPVVAAVAARQHLTPRSVGEQILLSAREKDLDSTLSDQPEVLKQIKNAVEEGDAERVLAWTTAALSHDSGLIRRPGVKETKLRRQAAGRLVPIDEFGRRILTLEPIPTPLAPGKDAHMRLKRLYEGKGDLSGVLADRVSIKSGKDGKVNYVGFEVKRATKNQSSLFPDTVPDMVNAKAKERAVVMFTRPIDYVPRANESKAVWGLNNLKAAWQNLLAVTENKPPLTPYDVLLMQSDSAEKVALTDVIELVQTLLPPDDVTQVIDQMPQSGGHYKFKTLSPLQIIDVLSVGKAILEVAEGGIRDGKVGVLSELSLGVISIDGVEIAAGFPDLVELRYPTYKQGVFGLNFSDIVRDSESQCLSRANRHRRLHVDSLENISQDYPSRELNDVVEQLLLRLSPKFLRKSKIIIRDHKLIVGDGGLDKILDIEHLPLKGHQEQIDDYLVGVAAIWCLADKRIAWAKEHTVIDGREKAFSSALTKQDLIAYIEKSKLFRRVRGVVSYPTPLGIKESQRKIPNSKKELEVWLEEFIARRKKANHNLDAIAVYSALNWLTQDRAETVETVRKEVFPVPGELGKVCVEFAGRKFLGIEELRGVLFESTTRIHKIIHIKKPDIKLIIFEGLDAKKGLYRLTIRKKDSRFNLSRIKTVEIPIIGDNKVLGQYQENTIDSECFVAGELSTTFADAGLLALAHHKEVVAYFEKYLWNAQILLPPDLKEVILTEREYAQSYDAAGLPIVYQHGDWLMSPGTDLMSGRKVRLAVTQPEIDDYAALVERENAERLKLRRR